MKRVARLSLRSLVLSLEIQGKQWLFEKIGDLMGYSLPHDNTQKVDLYDGKTIDELRKVVLDLSDVLDVEEM